MPNRPEPWTRALLLWPVRRPVATLMLAAIVLAASAASLTRLSFTPRLEALLPKDSPSTTALRHVVEDFQLLDQALILVETKSDEGGDDSASQEDRAARLTAFADRFKAAIDADAESRELVEGVEYRAAADITRFIEQVAVPNACLYLDDEAFAALTDRLSPPAMARQLQRNEALIAAGSPAAGQLSRQILRDPLRLHDIFLPAFATMRQSWRTWRDGEVFLSHDARSMLIRVSAAGPATDMDFTRRLMALLRRAVATAEAGDLRISHGGAYPIAELSEQVIRADMIGTVTGSLLLMQLLYLLAFRRVTSFPLVMLPVACGVLLGFGIYSVFFGAISPVTAGIGAILAGMGDDFSIHYLSHFESCRRRGMSVEQAADISQGLMAPMLHACGTSLVGFLAIATSSAPALVDFALLGALGLGGAMLGTITVLPATLALLERRHGAGDRTRPRLGPARLMERLQRQPRLSFIGVALVAAAAVVAAASSRALPWFGSDLNAMHPQPNPPLETHDRIAAQFHLSPDSALIHLRAGTPAELMALSAAVRERLDQPALAALGVRHGAGPAMFLPDPRRAARRIEQLRQIDRAGVIASFRKVVADSPFNPRAYETYEAFLTKLLDPGEPPGLSALAQHHSLAAMTLPAATLRDPSQPPTQAIATVLLTRPVRDMADRDQVVDAVRAALADLPGAQLTGLGIIGRDMEHTVRRELPRMAAVAGGVVLLWVIVLFHRPWAVGLALLPTAVAMLFVAAVLRFTGTSLNMVNMAAVPVLFGIAIDNGIFLVTAAQSLDRNKGANGGGEAAIDELTDRCHAITICTLTTILGFGSLMFASVPAMASLGLALTAGMAGGWIASVWLVIPLLLKPRAPT